MCTRVTDLYAKDSEVGRWLRTRNVIEKIGRQLIVHGGISEAIMESSLTIAQINQLARSHGQDFKEEYGDPYTNFVMRPQTAPFWFRGYYKNPVAEKVVDRTLAKFDVSHIITGHTIVADTISTHYQGKVINTDTKHAEGKSEALLIEKGQYYRVNGRGERVLLSARN